MDACMIRFLYWDWLMQFEKNEKDANSIDSTLFCLRR